jgi:adenylyltransferase/sulfurtransferase
MLIGLGGLGCPLAQYLASTGVGELHLCDFDTISESNLARQVLYTPDDIGRFKVDIAKKRLSAQNPDIRITSNNVRVDRDYLDSAIPGFDLLIDASDNYGTRLAVNKACLAYSKPWIMGACIRQESQVMLFDPSNSATPCYRCIYGNAPETLEDCPGAGIFAPVAGLTGLFMAHVALTFLASLEVPRGLNLFDAQRMTWQRLAAENKPDCPECSSS